MKRIYITKDLKGIKMNYEIKRLVDFINKNDFEHLNTYTLRFADKDTTEAYEDITYYALKNGMFKRDCRFDGNPCDLQRITWFLADLFNASHFDVERFLRSMVSFGKHKNHMDFYDRFGLNTLEIY